MLDGVTLDIEEGSFVAVLGHNGSGKSTLAKHMNAILLPTGGKVYVDGMNTADEDKLLDIRRTVGMVFQLSLIHILWIYTERWAPPAPGGRF